MLCIQKKLLSGWSIEGGNKEEWIAVARIPKGNKGNISMTDLCCGFGINSHALHISDVIVSSHILMLIFSI